MNATSLCLSFSAESQLNPCNLTIISAMEKVIACGYGGGMSYDYQKQAV